MTDSSPPDSSLPSETPPPVEVEPSVRYAGFWIRFGAYLIDTIIGFALGVGLLFMQSAMIYLVLGLVILLYKPFFEGVWGATPGKMLLGLKVTGKDFAKVEVTGAVIRNVFVLAVGLVSTISQYKQKAAGIGIFDAEGQQRFAQENMPLNIAIWVLGGIWIIAAVWVAFNARKRGLHDMLGDTFVVYKETLPRS